MKKAINKFLVSSFALLVFSGFNSAAPSTVFQAAGPDTSGLARALADDNRAPDVPDTIAVPAGHKVHFRGFARGFQIYTWNGADWGSAVPEATLFDDDDNVVATHFGGPTWESNSGSQVVGALPPLSVTVDPDAIPWLLLAAVEDLTHGPGIFANTTFVHRVNTVGGKAPSVDGTVIGQVARVPYTADYFFYRTTNKSQGPA